MKRQTTLFDLMQLNAEVGMMLAESQAVMAMRVMGWGGFWSVTDRENDRMMSEKTEAAFQSMTRAGTAMITGQQPHEIMKAAIQPLRSKTRANAKRLAKRGPKLG
ncbi:antifreeze protein [Loktanella sp. TSTF-M6]|uniref:Antifreeze protein n=1 Tax=Loktanella gaetbuli TaxID=2881335 RepID=A0ABS8BTS8_9RHOB|nr:antifreeze protein [Loktanella gaetbuli]MCB5198989.1 antifreeze protein [Loktanella gaetbuli]